MTCPHYRVSSGIYPPPDILVTFLVGCFIRTWSLPIVMNDGRQAPLAVSRTPLRLDAGDGDRGVRTNQSAVHGALTLPLASRTHRRPPLLPKRRFPLARTLYHTSLH